MRIAFFDSGIGGLSVLHQAQQMHPEHEYIYFADSQNAPYGNKPAAEVRDLVLAATDYIAALNPDALVVACNTATAVCIRELRARYPFLVIGMEPAIKPALQHIEQSRVLVMATSLTLQESKLSALLSKVDKQGRTDKLAMDRLVTFAEQQRFASADVEAYINAQLSHYERDRYAAVVLGCTHFIYFRALIQRAFPPQTLLVDGNLGTVKHLFNSLPAMEPPHTGASNDQYYVSARAVESARFQPFLNHLSAASTDGTRILSGVGEG